MLLVETEIYGLVSGPSWLRASLTLDLLAAGYVKNPYDKCLFTLFSNEDTSEGQVLIDVDEFIKGGKEPHRQAMDRFYTKYRCGKSIDLLSVGQEGTLFAGRRVVQHRDYRLTVSMGIYVRNKLRPIEVPKGYLSNTREVSVGDAHQHQRSQWWSWLVGINRKTRHGSNSLDHSIWYDRKSPQLISDINAAVKQCHAVPVTITIRPLLFVELRWTTLTDFGVDTGERQRHQQGWLVPSARKCALLAQSQTHTQSRRSATGGDLCR